MNEPEKPPGETHGPRAPSAADISERVQQLQSEFENYVQQVRAKLTADHTQALGFTRAHTAPDIFEAWAISKLARAEAYLEYYGSLLIAIGKKLQRSEKK